MTRNLVIVTLVSFASFVSGCARQDSGEKNAPAATNSVLTVGELTWPDIDALDRQKTLFLLVVGMLEEHGPHLPIAADTIGVEYEARRVAESLGRELPGWNVVLMPTVNYGSSGANQVGNISIHPGTYGLRRSTLRSLVADIGGQLAQNGFTWIFVMNGHGAPTHHAAVNEASDFISDTFNVTMLNVSGLFSADPAIQAQGQEIAARHFSAADRAGFGNDPHAGVSETSGILAVRPDLVRPGYRSLPSYRVENRAQMIDVASTPGWPGYFSSPAFATADYGREIEAWWVQGVAGLILDAVRGENLRTRPRWPEPLEGDPVHHQILERALAPEREFDATFERWLNDHKK